MSKYTTELRFICEQQAGLNNSSGYNGINNVLNNSWDKIFDFDFPIFDENYREGLCKKILRHFYTREICEETYGLWKLRLEDKMNILMPYYNKLYNSELLSIDPLINYRVNSSRKDTKSGSDSIADSVTENGTKAVMESTVRSGGYTDSHTGSSDVDKSGTETLALSGDKITTKTGKVEETNTQSGERIKETKGNNGTTSEDYVDLFTDTPQGNIANMGSSYTGGQGVPIVGSDTAYLTTAEKTNKTITDARNISETDKVSDGFFTKKTTEYDANDTPLEQKEHFNERQDLKTYNTNNKTTNNLTDSRTYNQQTDTRTDNETTGGSKTGNKTMNYGSVSDWMESVLGSKGMSDSKLLMEFRETFLNIDAMLIENLEDLFIMLW